MAATTTCWNSTRADRKRPMSMSRKRWSRLKLANAILKAAHERKKRKTEA